MAEKGVRWSVCSWRQRGKMVDVDQKTNSEELDASRPSGRGGVEQGGVCRVLVEVVEKVLGGEMYVTSNGLSRMLKAASDAWVWAVTWLPGTMEEWQSASSARSK